MNGESHNRDCKAAFDSSSDKAKLDLVKDLVAMANTGGGTVLFGHDEVTPIGIDAATVNLLDSAKVVEWARKFTAPAEIQLSHETHETANGKYLHSLSVEPAEFPIVMSAKGVWKPSGPKAEHAVFDVGDIFVRHSTRTERATYEDIRSRVLQARTDERHAILDRVTTLVNLPEGIDVQLVSQGGVPIDTPRHLLQNAVRRRERDPDHLLSSHDLLWLFQLRDQSDLPVEELRMVVASALRRSPTLYWWLLKAEGHETLLNEEVSAALAASDRDKSDASASIMEVSALYLDDSQLRIVIKGMRESRYAHFRAAAARWTGRSDALAKIRKRIKSARLEDMPVIDLAINVLEERATDLASRLSRGKSLAASRRLADITRVIWARKSKSSPL